MPSSTPIVTGTTADASPDREHGQTEQEYRSAAACDHHQADPQPRRPHLIREDAQNADFRRARIRADMKSLL
jgi:hypothetical protein